MPLWLWGGAGAGKTTMVKQLAAGLGVAFYTLSIDPTCTMGKLIGFRNLVTGEFVEGLLYKPFKEGGLVCLDEIDTGDASILAGLNSLITNDGKKAGVFSDYLDPVPAAGVVTPARPALTYSGPFPRARHAHRCARCGRGRSVYCYKAQCTKLRDVPNCQFCR